MSFFKNKIKKPYIFYLDKDEKYQYLIKESFKATHNLKLLSSEDAIIYEIKNVTSQIDSIIISIDEFNYHRVINEFYIIKKCLPNIIFMTNKYDSLVMQSLMVGYCANNYLIKPFTKSGIIDCLNKVNENHILHSKQLIDNDKKLFDNYYYHLTKNKLNTKQIEKIEIEPIEKQIEKLSDSLGDALNINENEERQVNILFFDDKKQSLNFYKQFVKKQNFNSFFTSSIKEAKEIFNDVGIDIILIEIKELDELKIRCIQEFLNSAKYPDVLAISSINIDEREINLMSAGVRLLLQKPLTNKKLIQFLNLVIQYRKIRLNIKEKLNSF